MNINNNNTPPLVVIQCLVYNHEPYLRDCLNGFVSQKTTFSFVAIVHDDASTDNGASIIREFADKFPEIIIPIYEKENQWRKTDGSLGRILNTAIDATGAKYIAICEGDDFWIDPYKLQKQIDILERYHELMACVTNACVVDNKGNLLEAKKKNVVQENKEGVYNIYDFFKEPQHQYPTATVVYRASHIDEIRQKFRHTENPYMGDWTLWIILHIFGNFYYIDDVTAAYRINPTSITHTVNRVAREKASVDICNRVADILPEKYADIASELRKTYWVWMSIAHAARKEKRYGLMVWYTCKSFFVAPRHTYSYFNTLIKRMLK